jgi:hypothetical protein
MFDSYFCFWCFFPVVLVHDLPLLHKNNNFYCGIWELFMYMQKLRSTHFLSNM